MSERGTLRTARAEDRLIRRNSPGPTNATGELSEMEFPEPTHSLFRAGGYAGNILLVLAILLAGYSAVWEYSFRKYLTEFSDAGVLLSSSACLKAEAIS